MKIQTTPHVNTELWAFIITGVFPTGALGTPVGSRTASCNIPWLSCFSAHSLASCASSGVTSSPRLGSPSTWSLTKLDTPSARRCSVPASVYRRDEIARTPHSCGLALSHAICCPHHGSTPPSALPNPTAPVCLIPCLAQHVLEMFRRTLPQGPAWRHLQWIASPTGSPRSLQKHGNSGESRNRQILAS